MLPFLSIPGNFDHIFHSSVGKESACNAGDPGLIPELGRSAGEGIGYHSSILGLPFVVQLVKPPNIIVLLSISPFMSVSVCLIH